MCSSILKPTVRKLITLVQILWVLRFANKGPEGLIWRSNSGQIEVANFKLVEESAVEPV